MGNVEEVEVDTETEEKSGKSGSEDLDYNPKNDEVFDDDDEHILEDVPVSKSNMNVNPDCKHDLSIHVFTKHYALLREYAQESSTRTFRRVYVCLGALKQGFKACGREFLGLDVCFMSSPFPCQLLTAVGVDANIGIYPVAYAVVDALNKASWCWFLKLLGEDLGIESNCKFTFISKREKGPIQAIGSVFPSAEHMFCVKHIHENMKSQFKGGVYKDMLWNAARANTVVKFNKDMDHLKSYNSAAYDWLIKIPTEHWSRSHFLGRAQCGVLLNNICEVFNRQLTDVRDQPIITCLEYIKEYLMKRIVVVQQLIDQTVGPLTPTVIAMFDAIKKEATDCVVDSVGGPLYQVIVPYEDQCVVNIYRRECFCRKWELTRIPCKHVVAAINHMIDNETWFGIPEDWDHAAYRLEIWARIYLFKINGCSGRDFWPFVESTSVIIPPIHKPQVDRSPKKKKKSVDELASQICSVFMQ